MAGNRAAARALPTSLFDPGGQETTDRLGRLGPLPLGTEATQLVAREIQRLDRDRRWFGTAATEPARGFDTIFGIGAGIGY